MAPHLQYKPSTLHIASQTGSPHFKSHSGRALTRAEKTSVFTGFVMITIAGGRAPLQHARLFRALIEFECTMHLQFETNNVAKELGSVVAYPCLS